MISIRYNLIPTKLLHWLIADADDVFGYQDSCGKASGGCERSSGEYWDNWRQKRSQDLARIQVQHQSQLWWTQQCPWGDGGGWDSCRRKAWTCREC